MHSLVHCGNDVHANFCLRAVSGAHSNGHVWLKCNFPFLIVPFGIANVISNTIMGGLGPLDMIGGGIVGIVTTSVIVLAKNTAAATGAFCLP